MAEKKPGSLSEASRYFFQRFWDWLSRTSLAVKSVTLLLTLVGLVILARLNIFGDPYFNYSKILLPHNIPYVDPKPVVVPLEPEFFIEDEHGIRPMAHGTTCYQGDRIHVTFKVGVPAWVTIIDVDAKGPHPVLTNTLEPSKVVPNELYARSFTLNDTVGIEVIYIIAASTQFSFKEDIEPYLSDKINALDGIKGPLIPKHKLVIPEAFVHKFSYCRHLAQE